MMLLSTLVTSFACASGIKGQIVVVSDGYVINPDGSKGELIGTTTSSLQSKVVDAMYPAVDAGTWQNVSILNSSVLRTLELHGDYTSDAQLKLPSLFQLKVFGEISLKPGATTSDRFGALVLLESVSYSAVLGGTLRGGGGFGAVSLVGCTRCSVRGIRGISDNHIIAVNGGSENEIANNDVGPGKGRCIWTLVTSRAMVHSNSVHDCASHALDFDAYTSDSIAYNNTCTGNGHEGIFVEETAKRNVIVGNTLHGNAGSGVGLYANVVGPVMQNVVLGNTISNNGVGITAGGMGHDPMKHSEGNLFVANSIFGNTEGANIHHGDSQGDLWMSNENSDSWLADPRNNSAVAVFDTGADPSLRSGMVLV